MRKNSKQGPVEKDSQKDGGKPPVLENENIGPVMPAVMPTGIYRKSQLLHNLGIGKDTWLLWKNSGLPTYPDLGTKDEIVFAEDIHEFIRKKHGEISKQAKQRREQKKKNRKVRKKKPKPKG